LTPWNILKSFAQIDVNWNNSDKPIRSD